MAYEHQGASLKGRQMEKLYTLAEVAEAFRWSTRTLLRRLKLHRIPTIGTGRLARVSDADIEALKLKEQQRSAAAMPSPLLTKEAELARINLSSMDARMKSYFRRRNAQLHRRPSKPK